MISQIAGRHNDWERIAAKEANAGIVPLAAFAGAHRRRPSGAFWLLGDVARFAEWH